MFHVMEQTATTRIASNLRAELGRRKLTGRKLALLCDWSVSNTSRRINGDQAMTVDELTLISRSADIPLSALLDGVESPINAAGTGTAVAR